MDRKHMIGAGRAVSLAALLTLFHPGASAFAGYAEDDALIADIVAEIEQLQARGHTHADELAVEERAIKRAKGRAERRGKVLILTLAKERQRRLANKEGCDEPRSEPEQCLIYRFVAHAPSRHLFLVQANFYEGGEWLLIDDRSGRSMIVSARPRFGPDPNLFLVIDDDYAYGSGDELQIWRRQGDRATREWNRRVDEEPSEHRVRLLRWEKDSAIELEFATEVAGSDEQQCWLAILRRAGNDWTLDMDRERDQRPCDRP